MKWRKIKIRDFDPVEFFKKAYFNEKGVSFLHGGNVSMIGFNPVGKFVSNHADFDGLKKSRENMSPAVSIGFFSYDLGYELFNIKSTAKDDLGLPLIYFNFYKNLLRFELKTKEIFTTCPDDIKRIWSKKSPVFSQDPELNFKPEMERKTYDKAFHKIQKYILDGDIYQVNLTHRLHSLFGGDRCKLFCDILKFNPAPFSAYLDFGDFSILSASPERFLKLDGRKIYTCPVKGTRPRGTTPAIDKHMREELLKSKKEEAELNMITDLLRNDIGQVSDIGSVRVTKHRALQKCPTVWHTYSEIVGTLKSGLCAIDLMHACMPGGSITGCPKKRSMEIIDELEPVKRGVYTGSIGYIDEAGNMDTGIAIRTLVAKDGKLFLNVGGGIVADSNAESEYEETLDKARGFLNFKSVFDPSNKRIDGVFETMRTSGREIFRLKEHFARLEKSAKIIGIKLPCSISEIKKRVLSCHIKKYPSIVKVVVTRDGVFVRATELNVDPAVYKGVNAVFYKTARKKPRAKALPYDKSFSAHEYAVSHGAYESLLVDKKGYVKEGAYSNLFWVKNGAVFTVGQGVLEGITRDLVRELTPVKFAEIKPNELVKADEVFITKTSAGIVPICKIDGIKIGNGKPGKIFKSLLSEISKSSLSD